MKFPESTLAHKYLDGKQGVEIGGSAHNPFNIVGCQNIDYTADLTTNFKQEEINLCGELLPVDIVADGGKLPFENESLDFVLSSHVLEHFRDPIAVITEWLRVVKIGGYIFAIIPHKDRTFDRDRICTTLDELIEKHNSPTETPTTHEHYSVWKTEDFVKLCNYMKLNLVEVHDADDKVGNGFMVVIKK